MTASGIDVPAARRRFERSASTYGEVAVLAREVERRMAERLDYMRHDPRWVLDAGCGPGEGLGLLRERYPKANLIGLDIARAMTHSARQARTILARARDLFSGAACHHVCADLARLPLAPASVAMVWSNLALAWAADPPAALSELARVLEPRGLLMFSTYGPDTLKELRGAFAGIDGYAHVHRFIDMHDLGDMLVAAGFADPVMDMEVMTLSYPDVGALARDLRRSGQSNVETGRRRGLMATDAWTKMVAAYESSRREARLPATFEIVYGHAWKGEGRADGAQVVKTDFSLKRRNDSFS
ncbi:MAG: malonyl-[acyl-carrier protein] O-methyltransferase BioC [Betaproteobacteria bacterium RIFCSPLOWO2_12_FULL_65_110]|nr:MAG: malonyl-[acyl-carrier protein] O-methyltransferase BioC [Betaproteobacteria bacterium RIFCSPLOWO2_12_FULL_65_110]